MKFHLTPNGPAPCSAEVRSCRYGNSDNHFADEPTALAAFEDQVRKSYVNENTGGGLFSVFKGKKSKIAQERRDHLNSTVNYLHQRDDTRLPRYYSWRAQTATDPTTGLKYESLAIFDPGNMPIMDTRIRSNPNNESWAGGSYTASPGNPTVDNLTESTSSHLSRDEDVPVADVVSTAQYMLKAAKNGDFGEFTVRINRPNAEHGEALAKFTQSFDVWVK